MSELALFGGPPAKNKPFPLWPQFDDEERRALLNVLEAASGGAHPALKRWSSRGLSRRTMASGTESLLPMELPRSKSRWQRSALARGMK